MNTSNSVAPVEVKAPSKMELARPLFAEIYAHGYKLSEGAKSQRAEFVKRSVAELGLTKHGAATYFQNLTNAARGEGTYKYTKRVVKVAEIATVAGAEQAIEALGDAPTPYQPVAFIGSETEIGVHRWAISNAAGKEVNSYSSRDKAKKAAAAAGLFWTDRTAD